MYMYCSTHSLYLCIGTKVVRNFMFIDYPFKESSVQLLILLKIS